MAKKDKDQTPNPTSIQNKDIIQRLNFLYQASVYLTNLSKDVPSTTPVGAGRERYSKAAASNLESRPIDAHPAHSDDKEKNKEERRATRRRIRTTDDLARAYIDTMTTVGKKTTVKMDPSIKRTLCKACNSVLIPGVSVRVRIKGSTSHKHAIVLKCVRCEYARKIPAPERNGWDGRARWDVQEGAEGTEDSKGVEEVGGGGVNKDEGKEEVVAQTNEQEGNKAKTKKKKGKKKQVHPPLPLSARRDAGHVVFRGNERVDVAMDEVKEVGDGVFAV
ncbi:hypothetical protein AX15_005283 [Amanita polypyramis BW_CC]|nr:hypothetical protein AX15_005283 [Amanita polypyramis BW_CC]